jgi:glycosyltransferase involved in cell wall biosynthesis
MGNQNKTVSIILIVRNESGLIRSALARLLALGAMEVIVSDGASADNTAEIVSQEFKQARLVRCERANRAHQMNRGAEIAMGQILLFAHADITFPANTIPLIQKHASLTSQAGGFYKKYVSSSLVLKYYQEILNRFYFKRLKHMVGTNGIYVEKHLFQRLGGYRELPFMEDVIFADDLRAATTLTAIEEPVLVSARRYEAAGVWKQIRINARIWFGFKFLGQDIAYLANRYPANRPQTDSRLAETVKEN